MTTNKIYESGLFVNGEAEAAAAIFPGMWVRFNDEGKLIISTVVNSNFRFNMLAIENHSVNVGVNDEYAVGSTVSYHFTQAGYIGNVRVAARTSAITKGENITPLNTGYSGRQTGSLFVIGRALDALNNSTNEEDAFVRIVMRQV